MAEWCSLSSEAGRAKLTSVFNCTETRLFSVVVIYGTAILEINCLIKSSVVIPSASASYDKIKR